VLDDRVREVLARLEREDSEEREAGLPSEERSRAVAPATGRFLFSLVAPQTACEVLEIGGSRGYSSIWLGAGVRYLGGRVLSIERDPDAAARWRENVREAGLEDWVELLEGDALELVPAVEEVFDHFDHARTKLEPGGLVVADNVISHQDTLGAYVAARQSDSSLLSTTVPLDRGLELSVVLTESL
jgi:caffeoyl-CoA O-methyltransferase